MVTSLGYMSHSGIVMIFSMIELFLFVQVLGMGDNFISSSIVDMTYFCSRVELYGELVV